MQPNPTKIPGYSGHIPSSKDKTNIEGPSCTLNKTHDLPPSLRFTSTYQHNYQDQMQYHDPLDDIVAPTTDSQVPIGEASKFFGGVPDDEDTLAKAAEVFYDDGTLYHEKLARQQETLKQASSKFHNFENAPSSADPKAWDSLPMSYEEARQRAYN
mmetsp:Transcript_13204/g.14836  ORF Transcript_13204/g.14836 Transcript_13204/m.14836 type:complete len:156 (-) Transcript_13204:33-500(-)|eukprot:CAMPEP_0205822796 /NCGR_PEP_ID=MMETSP0206-20130828/14071_1 /ASSEMBLY_ACC=CAM_ASM_000279 /TAXON_ID=36767 /ORGANISM="Euplotes focardii, Strain TN1" /LENGTH=155 /DNA_ID=CAMNT_0053119367 /DNA_START=28 /DNA_END=495 /DNA_ORIENTATION=+